MPNATLINSTAAAVAATPDNADIEALFRVWIEAMQRGLAICELATGLPPKNSFEEAYQVQDRIAAIPALTISDLAIKSYLAIYNELGAPADNLFDIDFTESQTSSTLPQQALFADAKRLSPLVAAAVHPDLHS